MNKFVDIVNILSNNNHNILEKEYQEKIEICFVEILNWKRYNGSLTSQLTIPIGNNNTQRPDIVLKKDNYLVPIEIKRPNNIFIERQVDQLASYMRQLQSKVGLFIDDHFRLYYDFSVNPTEKPVCVFQLKIKESENIKGNEFCSLLSYENFNKIEIEEFCETKYQLLKQEKSLIKMIESISEEEMKKILKEKLIKEGFIEESIDSVLKNININIKFKDTVPNFDTGKKYVNKTSQASFFKYPQVVKKDDDKEKRHFYFKGEDKIGRIVLAVVKQYVEENPNVTYNKLKEIFPCRLIGSKSEKAYNQVIRDRSFVETKYRQDMEEKKYERKPRSRYFIEDKDVIKLKDNTEVVVSTEWKAKESRDNFFIFRQYVELHLGYKIEEK